MTSHQWRPTKTMKAVAVFPNTKEVRLAEHPEPDLGAPTQVKIRVLDVGVCGTDKELVTFEFGTPPDGSEYLILGHECIGEVVEVGPEVTSLHVGDLAVPSVRRPCPHQSCLACRSGRQDSCYTGDYTERGIKQRHGFMTEFVVEEAKYVCSAPKPLRDVGVLIEPLSIAEKAMCQISHIQQRLPWTTHRALVLGAGPVGLLGAMKLVIEGFDTYIYSHTGGSETKPTVAKAIGATFIDADKTPFSEAADSIGNIDVVYEAVGASGVAFEALERLGSNGIFVFTGVPGRKSHPAPLNPETLIRDLVMKNQVVIGTVNAGLKSFQDAIRDLGHFLTRWPDAVRLMISKRFPIDFALEPLTGKSAGIKEVIAVSK